MHFVKVANQPSLVRDLETNAVLTTDFSAVRKHEKRISDLQKEEARERKLSVLERDISEIKHLLKQLAKSPT